MIAKWARFHTVLHNRQYMYWLFSANVASVGYSVYAISIVWLAYTLSRSYFIVGLVLFAETATYAVTFLVAPAVDRFAINAQSAWSVIQCRLLQRQP